MMEILKLLGEQMQAADVAYVAGERPTFSSQKIQAGPILQPRECDRLLAQISEGQMRDGLVTSPHNVHEGIVDPARYIAREAFFNPTEPQFAWLLKRLAPYIAKAEKQFGFNGLELVEAGRLIRYGKRGHFNWHPDGNIHVGRQLTVSLQLSPAADYSGGDLMILDDLGSWACADRGQGTGCLFPARLLHRVTDVTQGCRYVIVLWFYLRATE